jgi:hypothetical protein
MMAATNRTVLDSTKILETRELNGYTYEVCATTRASFDESSSELCVQMDSFLRKVKLRGKDEILHPSWLPRSDATRVHVPIDESFDAAQEICHSWAEKVRKSVPSEDWLETATAS